LGSSFLMNVIWPLRVTLLLLVLTFLSCCAFLPDDNEAGYGSE
jgi:hypothetical protein